MQQVITAETGRKILRGRTPNVPVEYETAVKALEACCTLDETKYWSDKSDALAAWAKIYRDGKVLRQAKMLKLHAFRRMGQISEELRPVRPMIGKGNGRGRVPGPRSLLKAQGLTASHIDAARCLGGLSERKFEKLLNADNPISPTTARYMRTEQTVWHDVCRAIISLRSVMRRHTPASVAAALSDVEAETARGMVAELTEWLDELDRRATPKKKAA